MRRRSTGWITIGIAAALLTGAVGAPGAGARSASASGPEAGAFTRGARGAGDPYFPADGNGGYDVGHYGLELVYDPDNDVLEGVATIDARSTQGLSRFNLDFDGMTVDSVTVDGQPAAFARNRGELKVTPPAGIPVRTHFQVVVAYHGVPDPLPPEEGGGGWIPTEDGVVVVGQPHVASTWFPANDHPKDRATFDVAVTVPEGLEAVSNGRLVSHDTAAGETRWVWAADAPMAPYLATLDVGELELAQYHDAGARPGGVEWLDAVDPALRAGFAPRTGAQLAFSQAAQQTFKRLRRTVAVPPEGATLTFWVQRDTETDWDHFFVEARHLGQADWTTLPDANGHTTTGTGASCPYWLDLHPALRRYQTDLGDGTCAPTGTTGGWNAVSGFSDGWEQWSVDLGAYAGSTAQVALTYVSDDSIQGPGVAVDDVEVSTGEGSTSFEDDGDPLDGWTVPGAPQSSEANTNDWTVITEAGAPPSYGEGAQQSLGRGPEILAFLADRFGDYPFADAGGIVDDVRGLGFALENQTRPVYAPEFFGDPEEGDAVVVHELAHQWFGDERALWRWKHIWLNEGFATYAEWLWAEDQGIATAQELFDSYHAIPARSPFWSVVIGDPGPDLLFSSPVYYRGAMALHALRLELGDEDFFALVRQWAAAPSAVRVTTRNFVALAEEVAERPLGDLFREWVRRPGKPPRPEAAPEATSPATAPREPLATPDAP